MGWLAVAVGGAVGSILRYALSLMANQPVWPYGTWIVNIVGSFCIGALAVWGKARGVLSPELYLLFATGLMGGFTTFSTFSLEVVTFWLDGHYSKGIAYGLTSMVASISACAAGIWLARQFSMTA